MPATETSSFPKMRRPAFLLISVLLLLFRIPFLTTHHVQEDSYITFRTAFNLADHGVFSFNLGEHIPGTTSLLYPLLVAAMRLVFHGWTVYAVQIFGSGLVIAGCWLLTGILSVQDRYRVPIWIAAACTPMSLFVGYSGMETALVVFDVALLASCIRYPGRRSIFYIGLFLLPFLRPDAISYGAIFCLAMFCLDRKSGLIGSCAVAAGVAALMLTNFAVSGQAITGTMRAKEIAYHPSHQPAAVMHRLTELYFGKLCFLVPLEEHRLYQVAFLFLPIIGVCAWYLLRSVKSDRRQQISLWSLLAIVLIVPAAYAVGGVIFPWYTYPSNWIAETVAAGALVWFAASRKTVRASRAIWACIALLLGVFAAWQWVTSFIIGAQEYHYRADVGRYLWDVSHGQGTLLLEPAGYIPFYSQLSTQDEVGLVSDRILGYMKSYPSDWWIRYVENEHPTFIVQRDSFLHYQTYQGYQLSPAQIAWFDSRYRLLGVRSYDPYNYFHSSILRRILKHSWVLPHYVIYQSREAPAPASH